MNSFQALAESMAPRSPQAKDPAMTRRSQGLGFRASKDVESMILTIASNSAKNGLMEN